MNTLDKRKVVFELEMKRGEMRDVRGNKTTPIHETFGLLLDDPELVSGLESKSRFHDSPVSTDSMRKKDWNHVRARARAIEIIARELAARVRNYLYPNGVFIPGVDLYNEASLIGALKFALTVRSGQASDVIQFLKIDILTDKLRERAKHLEDMRGFPHIAPADIDRELVFELRDVLLLKIASQIHDLLSRAIEAKDPVNGYEPANP